MRQHPNCKPDLSRYLAIIFYDVILLLSVLMLTAFVAVALNGGKAISHNNPLFLLFLLAVSFSFYGWFWINGGQTLGMRAWRVQLISDNNKKITWQQAFIRFVVAIMSCLPLGLGFWWQYLSKRKKSWPDILSSTQLYYTKK